MGMQAAQKSGRDLRTRDEAPGALPLKNPQHEKLAREFAAGASMAASWRAIGRDPAVGNQWRTFRRPDIQDRIAFLQNEFNRMAGISLAALQARLLRIADANVVDLFEMDTTTRRLRLRDLTTLSRAVTAPIAELQINGEGGIKLKAADKLHAIDSLLKTIGGFAPEGPECGASLEDLVMRSMELRKEMHLSVITGVPRTPDEAPASSGVLSRSAAPTDNRGAAPASDAHHVRLWNDRTDRQ